MLHLGRSLRSADALGVGKMRVVGIYGVRPRPRLGAGFYGRGVVTEVAFLPRFIRGRRYKPVRVGFVLRFVSAACHSHKALCGALRPTNQTLTGLSIKRRGTLKAKRVLGPGSRPRPTRRFWSSLKAVV